MTATIYARIHAGRAVEVYPDGLEVDGLEPGDVVRDHGVYRVKYENGAMHGHLHRMIEAAIEQARAGQAPPARACCREAREEWRRTAVLLEKAQGELEQIRDALDGYPDSDLASLATTIVARLGALEAERHELVNELQIYRLREALTTDEKIEAASAEEKS